MNSPALLVYYIVAPFFFLFFVAMRSRHCKTLILSSTPKISTESNRDGLLDSPSLRGTGNISLVDGEGSLPLLGGGVFINLSDGIEMLQSLVGDNRRGAESSTMS